MEYPYYRCQAVFQEGALLARTAALRNPSRCSGRRNPHHPAHSLTARARCFRRATYSASAVLDDGGLPNLQPVRFAGPGMEGGSAVRRKARRFFPNPDVSVGSA